MNIANHNPTLMSLKRILIIIILFAGTTASAQKIKNQATYRMLQTANTLMEAQQFEAAEEFLKKGLSKAIETGDIYCQAFANQGLGTLYAKLDQPEMAAPAYRQAIYLYRNQKQDVIANVVESLLKSVQGIGDTYAGVEIGAKGIKLTVIDVKLSKDREYDYTLKGDTAINTDAAALSYQSEKETSDAISMLYNIIRTRYQVPVKRIHIVISSGLKQELDKYDKVEYFANIVRPKELDSSIRIAYITPQQESELSLLGIVPQKQRFITNQFDIGSGNTKGGYFNAYRTFIPVTFPLGTKSFQRLIESKTHGDINDYKKTAEQIWKDSLSTIVSAELEVKTDFRTRDVMYLSGGIVWAIASLMHPQTVNNNYVELSSQDISDFRRLVFSNYSEAIQPNLTLISNPDVAQASRKNIVRVLNTFDQKALIAGTIWLDELVKQINYINPSKKFVYPKYAYIGWISGYIIKKVTQQYTGLVN